MGELVFYDALASGNTYKVRLLLAQLGRPHRAVRLDLPAGEVKAPAFRQQNPLGRVPFIVDGDFKLAESGAILLWLARGTPLLPDDPRDQARVHQWLFFEQSQLAVNVGLQRWMKRWMPDAPERPTIQGFIRPRADTALADLDAHLAGAEFLVGDRYSVADIACFAYAHLAFGEGHDEARFPQVARWVGRVRRTPGFIAM